MKMGRKELGKGHYGKDARNGNAAASREYRSFKGATRKAAIRDSGNDYR